LSMFNEIVIDVVLMPILSKFYPATNCKLPLVEQMESLHFPSITSTLLGIILMEQQGHKLLSGRA
ncbi:MAG: hypothetical protein L0K76_04750, partial [Lentilactobacillus parabuchneri]|nr:hypothetical protein [Lentilactobacillus parabuchneri]